MNVRPLYIGMLAGLPITLLLTLPLYITLPAFYIAGWSPATPFHFVLSFASTYAPEWVLPGALVGVASSIATLLAFGLIIGAGALSSFLGKARTRKQAIQMGLVSGGIIGILVWLRVGAAAAGVIGNAPIWVHGSQPAANEVEGLRLVAQTLVRIVWTIHLSFWSMLGIGALLGAVGAYIALRRGWTYQGSDPRTLHPTVKLALTVTLLVLTALQVLVIPAIFLLLGERAGEVYINIARDQQALGVYSTTASIAFLSISAWPALTAYAVVIALIWWLWQQITVYRIRWQQQERRRLWRLSAFAVGFPLILVMLLLFMSEFSPYIPLLMLGVIGITSVTLVESYRARHMPTAVIQQDTAYCTGWVNWLDYWVLLWLAVAVISTLVFIAVPLAMVLGPVSSIGILFNFSSDPLPLSERPDVVRDVESLFSFMSLTVWYSMLAVLALVPGVWFLRFLWSLLPARRDREVPCVPPAIPGWKIWLWWSIGSLVALLVAGSLFFIATIGVYVLATQTEIGVHMPFASFDDTTLFTAVGGMGWGVSLIALGTIQGFVFQRAMKVRGAMAWGMLGGLLGWLLGSISALLVMRAAAASSMTILAGIVALAFISCLTLGMTQALMLRRYMYLPAVWGIVQVISGIIVLFAPLVAFTIVPSAFAAIIISCMVVIGYCAGTGGVLVWMLPRIVK